eukprot:762186-Hanusia_phi.AAC.6
MPFDVQGWGRDPSVSSGGTDRKLKSERGSSFGVVGREAWRWRGASGRGKADEEEAMQRRGEDRGTECQEEYQTMQKKILASTMAGLGCNAPRGGRIRVERVKFLAGVRKEKHSREWFSDTWMLSFY